MEQWKDIPGFENYMVSDQGRVWSKNRQKLLRLNSNGFYHFVVLRKNFRSFQFYVHRLVMLTFVGECPEGHEVNHINGIKTDNRLENLEYVTRSENGKHAYRIGLNSIKLGEAAKNVKLNWNKVNQIREMYATGNYTQKQLAVIFIISESQINRIINNQDWKNNE